jgi:hypothetical protein
MSRTSGPRNALFPKTTNQDFHGSETFKRVREIGYNVENQYNKKMNPYAAFVNANFNCGVFTNPWQERIENPNPIQ